LNGLIEFTVSPANIGECEIFWLAYDTPIDQADRADVNFVFSQFEKSLPFINSQAIIIISSQLPVGSARKLKNIANSLRIENNFKYCVQPENLRLGKALESFLMAESIILGTESGKFENSLEKLHSKFKMPIIWMGLESAEMTKHAINSFLASSITFMGEISDICELVGANSRDVEKGLRSDSRIGKKIYVSPGLGFAGGTLARDVKFLEKFQKNRKGIISSIIQSNEYNNNWMERKFETKFLNEIRKRKKYFN
jgi:UDPglucose 6-dehydrogenase